MATDAVLHADNRARPGLRGGSVEVRWGFIGAGDVTRVRAPPGEAFTQEGSRVLAVACSDLERARAYATAHGIPRAYPSAAELCADPEVDAVYICTPHHLHAEHTLLAVQAGKHILCEKPMANSTAEGLAAAQAAEAAGVLHAIAYYRRFYPVVEHLKSILDSGKLGTLTTAHVLKHDYFIPPRETLATDRRSQWRTAVGQGGGGTLNETGCHRLDLLLYLLGEVQSVSAELERFEAWYEGEDQASVTIRFRNRVIAQADHSWCSRSPRDLFEVTGTAGRARVEDLEGNRLLLQIGGSVETIEVKARPRATHRPLVADFCRALIRGGSVRCSGWDGLRATQLIEHAYIASREKRTEAVPSLESLR